MAKDHSFIKVREYDVEKNKEIGTRVINLNHVREIKGPFKHIGSNTLILLLSNDKHIEVMFPDYSLTEWVTSCYIQTKLKEQVKEKQAVTL